MQNKVKRKVLSSVRLKEITIKQKLYEFFPKISSPYQ